MDKSISPNPIILRKFLTPARSGEFESFERMSSAKIGPQQLAVDPESHYRIEQYIESRILKCHEINEKSFRRKLALKLAAIHRLTVSEKVRESHIVRSIEEWAEPARNNSNPSLYDDESDRSTARRIAYLFSQEELDFVQKVIQQYDLVWSHNDIWTGNILVTIPEDDVVIVDYEVTYYNFRGYDIGKLMMEVLYERDPLKPTYVFKSIDHLPSRDDVLDFLRCYLIISHGATITDVNDESEIQRAWKTVYPNEEDGVRELEQLFKEVEVGIMISGFYSALLGMWIGKNPAFALDFIKFSDDGLNMYEAFKKKLFQ